MPAQLSDARLLSARLPAEWTPLLHGLADLAELLDEAPGVSSERRARASAIRQRLLETAAPLLDEPIPEALAHDAPEHRRWFTESVLLWLRFAEIGATPRLDTLKTRSLDLYPVDLESSEANAESVRSALRRAFDWSAAELQELDSRIERLSANLTVKKAITASITGWLLEEGEGRLSGRSLGLFRSIYGELPLREGDVHVVVTGSALYFALAYRGLEFLGEGFEARPTSDRELLAGFLEQLRRRNSFRTARFPSFGLYDPSAVDPELLRRVWERVHATPGLEGIPQAVVEQTFHTMPSILPRELVDQYLVHDAWGHGWQESLCEFEWLYGEAVHLNDPVGPETGERAGLPAGERFAAAFTEVDGQASLDVEQLDRVVEADLRRRIRAAANTFLSEVFADLVEHKYVRQVRPAPEDFPSSSLLPDTPLKVDLSLNDARLYGEAWSSPYRRLFDRPEAEAALTEELAAAGCPREGLPEAVALALERIRARFGSALTPSVSRPSETETGATVVQRLTLQAVAMDAELERFLAEGDRTLSASGGRPRWQVPEACVDLLVLTLAWFYEQDHDRTLWHLDELLRTALEPSLRVFGRALRVECDGK